MHCTVRFALCHALLSRCRRRLCRGGSCSGCRSTRQRNRQGIGFGRVSGEACQVDGVVSGSCEGAAIPCVQGGRGFERQSVGIVDAERDFVGRRGQVDGQYLACRRSDDVLKALARVDDSDA